jgi:hypothetical protein
MSGSISYKPRVLIVSNNVLSTRNNNGKTLLSLFKSVPRENVSQLYFSSEEPESGLADSYYRISDSDVLNSVLRKRGNKISGGVIRESDNDYFGLHDKTPSINVSNIKKLELARIFRELIWKLSSWNGVELRDWIKKVDPDIVFFCAGDSLFAHRIYNAVANSVPSARKVVYVTDDYIMPRFELSPFWWLRRNFVYSHMKRSAINSDVFVTISEEMRIEYLKRFGKDSITVFNTPENLKVDNFGKSPRDDFIMVYAGGLHFERWKTLNRLALDIKKFNQDNERSIRLKIFSHQSVDQKVRSALNVPGASEFLGALDHEGVKFHLNDADVLVHVESFSRKCIASTRLSISTKIGDYLSVGSPILAIGPKNIASMRFLRDFAHCITSTDGCFSFLHNLSVDCEDFGLSKSGKNFHENLINKFEYHVLNGHDTN